jgi:hypothetical protein
MGDFMILGLSVSAFTILHVVISLIAIASGLVVLLGLLSSQRRRGWTVLFLATTLMTNLTGFLFPIAGFTPALGLGIISTVVLLPTALSLYAFHRAGGWRWVYVVGAVLVLYFNVFVAVVQAFQKLSFLEALAPTQSEPPFLVAQAILAIFVVLGFLAVSRFHPR